MSTEQYPSTAEVRSWAQSRTAGASVTNKGRLPQFVILAWDRAHPDRPYVASQAHHGTPAGYTNHDCRCDRCLPVGRAHGREVRSWRREDRADEKADELLGGAS